MWWISSLATGTVKGIIIKITNCYLKWIHFAHIFVVSSLQKTQAIGEILSQRFIFFFFSFFSQTDFRFKILSRPEFATDKHQLMKSYNLTVKYSSYHGWIWSSDRFISPFNLLEYQIDNLSHFVSQKTLKWHLGTFFRMDDDTSVQFWNKFPKKEIFKKIFPSIVRTVHLSKLLMHVGLLLITNRLVPDQDRKIFRNLGPVRTRTERILEIPDQLGPGPIKFWKSRTDSDRSVPGPGGSWVPDS